MYLAMHLLDIKTSKNNFWSWYSGSQSHTTRRGRASCSLWYAPVANVCDLLLFLDENRVIPDFRHFWKVTSPDEELFTVLYFPFDAFPMTWPRKLFTGLNSTGMMVTWLKTLANTRGGFVTKRSSTIVDDVIGHHACAMTMTCERRLLTDRCWSEMATMKTLPERVAAATAIRIYNFYGRGWRM